MISRPALALLGLLGLAPLAGADTFTGQVVDHNGVGVAGVNITADDLVFGGDGNMANGGTNALGFFTVAIDPGLYEFTFEPPAPPAQPLVTQVVTDVLVAGVVDIGVIQLREGAILSGRVLTAAGPPAVNLNLDIYDRVLNENLLIRNDATDLLGNFSVVAPVGPIELRFKPAEGAVPLHAPMAFDLNLTGNTNMGDLQLELGYMVTAVVLDPGFAAVRDADIDVLDPATGDERYTPGDNTDNAGFVDFVVPAGTFDIEICPRFSDGLAAGLVQGVVITGTTNMGIVTLQPGVVLSGHITSHLGANVADADVDLFDATTGVEVTLCGDNTDAAGNYAVVVPSGQFDVVFTPPYSEKLRSRTYSNVTIAGNTTRNGVLQACDCGDPFGAGRAGSGGLVPQIAAVGNSLRLGNPAWGFDVTNGLGGAPGVVFVGLGGSCGSGAGGGLYRPMLRMSAPMPFTLDGAAGVAGAGSASFAFELPSALALVGTNITARALVFDAGAASGIARTPKLCGALCQ